MTEETFSRSAHASIGGYLYQACVGVLRWLELKEGEVLFCEGHEDLDKLFGDDEWSEQLKRMGGSLNIRDEAVSKSLAGFLSAYRTLNERGENRRFRFTTTAQRRNQRGDEIDLLRDWDKEHKREKVIASARKFLQDIATKDVTWLDEDPARWHAFVEAVEWRFDEPDIDEVRRLCAEKLSSTPGLQGLGDLLEPRLLAEVFRASTYPQPTMRMLRVEDRQRVLAMTRGELELWADGRDAGMLRQVALMFDRVLDDREDRKARKELIDLLRTTEPTHPLLISSPTKLLRAQSRVVPLYGRDDELTQLDAWLNDGAPFGIRLFTGPGGSGKTRLLIEWCSQLEKQGIPAGFVASEKDTAPLLAVGGPRVAVFDYAETRTGQLEELLRQVRDRGAEAPGLRVVLIARREGDWWQQLCEDDHDARQLVQQLGRIQSLDEFMPGEVERRALFDRAAVAFRTCGKGKEGVNALVPDLNQPHFAQPLFVLMGALAGLDGKRISGAQELLDETLEHEKAYWKKTVKDQDLDKPTTKAVRRALDKVLPLLTLWGGAGAEPDAEAIVEHAGTRSVATGPMLDVLRTLYAGHDGRWISGLEPDILGEHLVAKRLVKDKGLLGLALDEATDDQRKHSLTVLTRLAQRRPMELKWLIQALLGRLETLAILATKVALETGDPIGPALAEAVNAKATPELAKTLMELCPERTVALRELAETTTRQVLEWRKETCPEPDDAQLLEIARLTGTWANKLSTLGRREDALRAAKDAVSLFEELAERSADDHSNLHAGALNNLGMMLSNLGRREDALEATIEAVDIRRILAKARPDAFLPDLAGSLASMSQILTGLDRREQAHDSIVEAIAIFAPFFHSIPAAHGQWIGMMVKDYLECCKALDREPDHELLAPIMAKFQELQGDP